ncbi:glycosyltransferase [Heliobacterium chlorum]|uniref:Glycosyltransferase n=1 Tax=Heliobacterium chlorum TaxID=2698 RepID=A0ABR7T2W2_HELCL|nr:glycosyltransferase [Heliobacterium chlorum]MBC9784462.1 glycosyltransferase [Heliobacterium chlorum]
MKRLSLAMIVKNESKNLSNCLSSVKGIVDEIVIVDTGSSDDTKEIARSYGAKIYDYTWENDFSKARNVSLQNCTGDWILVLDADETVIKGERKLFDRYMNTMHAIGRVRRMNKFLQGEEIRYSQDFISRLFPRGAYYEGRVHEQVISDLPRFNTEIDLHHEGYFQTDKTERNLTILLTMLDENPSDPYTLYQVGKQYRLNKRYDTAEPYFEKCYQQISVQEIYRPSLVVNYLYNLLNTKNFKIGLEVIANEKTILADYPDFHFACGLFYMELIFTDIQKYVHLFPLIEQSYRTCLELGETRKYDSVIGTGTFLPLYNLGVFYESLGDRSKALDYYRQSAAYDYLPACNRIAKLEN